jgi:hypothetical protein
MESVLVNAIASMIAFAIFAVPFGLIGVIFYLAYGWPFVAARKSPPSDITKIKVRLDGEAHRVVDIRRSGTDWAFESRTITAWRKYDLEVVYPDGTRVPRTVGVRCTLLSEPSLVAYKEGVRTGIWTLPQLNPY